MYEYFSKKLLHHFLLSEKYTCSFTNDKHDELIIILVMYITQIHSHKNKIDFETYKMLKH